MTASTAVLGGCSEWRLLTNHDRVLLDPPPASGGKQHVLPEGPLEFVYEIEAPRAAS